MYSQYTSGVCVLVLDTKCTTNPQSSSRGRPAVEKRSEWQIHFRSSTCTYVYTCARVCAYVRTCVLNFQAASRVRPLACACVRSHPSTCVGSRALAGCCVYASATKDASIARTHLECRHVFLFKDFQDVLHILYICFFITVLFVAQSTQLQQP